MRLPERPIIIAGPCMAENYDIMAVVAESMLRSAEKNGFQYFFKASFDKANRSSIDSYRGPGIGQASGWFERIKKGFGCPMLTDVHEIAQVGPAAEFCDAIQIPAFLCRQTDLLVAAARSGRIVNIKKGQFMAPGAMVHAVQKVRSACAEAQLPVRAWLTERGSMYGYGDLTVDMRSLAIMAENAVPVIFDITHSTQKPQAGTRDGVSGAARQYAPLLARSALATGYVSGFFLEVHPDPLSAKSDADAQLTPDQAAALLDQLCQLWGEVRDLADLDAGFS